MTQLSNRNRETVVTCLIRAFGKPNYGGGPPPLPFRSPSAIDTHSQQKRVFQLSAALPRIEARGSRNVTKFFDR